LAALAFLALALMGLGVLTQWHLLSPFASLASDIGLISFGGLALKIMTAVAGYLGFSAVHGMISKKSWANSWPGSQPSVAGTQDPDISPTELVVSAVLYGDETFHATAFDCRDTPVSSGLLLLNPATWLVCFC
jgi:hypothetical protein